MFASREVRLRDNRKALIRCATSDDAEALIANANAVGAEGIYILTERLDKTPEQEREWIARSDGERLLLVALVEGVLLGAMGVTRPPQEKVRHLAGVGIAIEEAGRGVGLGRAMMELGIEWARSRGVRKLHLSVFDSNRRAKALYRALGFVEEGRLKGHVVLRGVPGDLVMMALWL